MKGPTPRRLQKYVARCLGLKTYLRAPGDGRVQAQIPAAALLWALLVGQILREFAFHAVEALVRSRARRALGVSRAFGDDALAYFTARLSASPTRAALAQAVRLPSLSSASSGLASPLRPPWTAVDRLPSCLSHPGHGCLLRPSDLPNSCRRK